MNKEYLKTIFIDSKEVNPAILENDFSRVEIFKETSAKSESLFLPRLVIAIIGTLILL